MVVESDYLDEIALFLFVFFEFFFDYLFEAINNELFDKRRRCSFCKHEFLVGLGVHLEPLHIKEGKADVKASAARKLLDPLFVHPFKLDNKQFAILIHLRKQFFLLWLLNLDRAIIFDTSFNMFFYVANQQHIGIFIVMTVMNQQQNILQMTLELLPCFEFKIRREQIVNIGFVFVGYIQANERESTKPDDHGSLKLKVKDQKHLTDGEHQNSPKIVSREDAKEFPHSLAVVGLLEMIEIEEPQSRKEHENNINPRILKRSETKDELAYHFVYDEDDLPI